VQAAYAQPTPVRHQGAPGAGFVGVSMGGR
jgi:hypothetical protein